MYANNLHQLNNLIYFIFTGMLLGVIFDIFRVLRISFKTSDIITNIQDIFFGIITGCIILVSVFLFNNGELRLYIFIGIGIGIIMYVLLFSKCFIKVNTNIIKFIKKMVALIIQPIIILLKNVKKLFFKPICFIFINIRFMTKKTLINLKKTKNR